MSLIEGQQESGILWLLKCTESCWQVLWLLKRMLTPRSHLTCAKLAFFVPVHRKDMGLWLGFRVKQIDMLVFLKCLGYEVCECHALSVVCHA